MSPNFIKTYRNGVVEKVVAVEREKGSKERERGEGVVETDIEKSNRKGSL